MNESDIVKKLEKLITRELKTLRKKVGEINLMLSGGVDSAVLAALDKPDKVFTVRLPYGPVFDEFDDAMTVVKHLGLEDKHFIIDLDESEFDEVMIDAVKAIGEPIPHFNIFPLYVAFRGIQDAGITNVVVGDGPDESMCGYTRHLIMDYLYKAYDIEAFDHYGSTIAKILPPPYKMYMDLVGRGLYEVSSYKQEDLLTFMCEVDMDLKRKEMTTMSHRLAERFDITLHAPYEQSAVDEFMFKLPNDLKVSGEYGKYALRLLADKYLPKEIAWRKQKMGGPLVPVNQIKGWNDISPYEKGRYMRWQQEILNSVQ